MVKKWIYGFTSTLVGFAFIGIGLSANCAAQIDNRLVNANNDFGFRLFRQVTSGQPLKNVTISPYSVSAALYMTYNGSAGSTRGAMASTLGLDGMTPAMVNNGSQALMKSLKRPDPLIEFQSANSLWTKVGYPINQNFINQSKRYYNADVSSLKGAPGTINAWVSRNTKGRIPKIVNSVHPLAVLFLVNATYFKGQWQTKFDKALTQDADFHLANNTIKKVKMMRQIGDQWYLKGNHFQAVKLPYGKGRMSMYIFLPDPDSNLPSFLKVLDSRNWHSWMSGFTNKEVEIGLPRFKMEWGQSLADALQSMGMTIAFTPGKADFANITPDRNAYIYDVMHKTFIKVDEEGTEAAAATSVEIRTKAVRVIPRVVMDRPFFYAIRDESTGTVLFMGTVGEPVE